MVTPAYFETFGISMRRGRAFTERDRAGSVPVAIVNEAFVKRFLQGVDPLGQRLVMGGQFPAFRPPARGGRVADRRRHGEVANGGPERSRIREIDVPFWQCPGRGRRWRFARPASRRRSAGIAEILRAARPGPADGRRETMEQVVTKRWPPIASTPYSSAPSRGRAAAGGGGDLRRDVVSWSPAHARDRPAHGARRGPRQVLGRSFAKA